MLLLQIGHVDAAAHIGAQVRRCFTSPTTPTMVVSNFTSSRAFAQRAPNRFAPIRNTLGQGEVDDSDFRWPWASEELIPAGQKRLAQRAKVVGRNPRLFKVAYFSSSPGL